MPRSKLVKPEEAHAKLVKKLQKLIDTTRSSAARKFLRDTANQLANGLRLLEFLLNCHKLKPRPTKKQLEAMLQIDEKKLAADTDYSRMTTDDFELYGNLIDYFTLFLTGREAEAQLTQKALAQFMRRESERKVKPRKFKAEFVNAFEARQKALEEGKGITLQKLAARFTPVAYARNEASAIRNMGQALRRIERDQQRLGRGPGEVRFVANENIRDKNVHQR